MNIVKKCLVMGVAVSAMTVGLAVPASAAPPGPGDKQCVPGQNSPPQPGKKGGTCPP